MGKDINKGTLVGTISRDPVYRQTGGKQAFFACSVRTECEKTTYTDVVAFGAVADSMSEVDKGARVTITYHLGSKKDKNDQWGIQVVADEIVVEGRKPKDNGERTPAGNPASSPSSPSDIVDDEDLPF